GNPGCPAGNECVLLTGSPGSPANGYCCPYGTACQMPGGLCFALSGRTQNANDACRAGVCSYDISPARPTDGGSAPEATVGDARVVRDAKTDFFDGPLVCPAREDLSGGESTLCDIFTCEDPEQNGDYNPCLADIHCDFLATNLCISTGPVPDGT